MGLTLSRDAVTGVYSFSTGGLWPADGLKGGVTNAQGHSSYFTTALSVRSNLQLLLTSIQAMYIALHAAAQPMPFASCYKKVHCCRANATVPRS